MPQLVTGDEFHRIVEVLSSRIDNGDCDMDRIAEALKHGKITVTRFFGSETGPLVAEVFIIDQWYTAGAWHVTPEPGEVQAAVALKVGEILDGVELMFSYGDGP